MYKLKYNSKWKVPICQSSCDIYREGYFIILSKLLSTQWKP